MMNTVLSGTLNGREFAQREHDLRQALLAAQLKLASSDSSLLLIISGMDGAGKGELINRFAGWLDPRTVETHSYYRSSEEERERPSLWRFWRSLAPRGRVGVHFGAWYTQPIVDRMDGRCTAQEFGARMDEIVRTERMLADDGVIVLKLWLYLSRHEQERRLHKLERDPQRHWKFTGVDWNDIRYYDDFSSAAQEAVERTDRPSAPWYVIDAADDEFRDITAGGLLAEALRTRLETPPRVAAPKPSPSAGERPLDKVDLKRSLDKEEYRDLLQDYQAKLYRLAWRASERKTASVLVFEGWDAAGKGGAIRRLTAALDAQLYRVHRIAAPSGEERAHHYLWRFWRTVPRDGDIAVFDRSWYGRVLVERVEGYADQSEWRRAYDEINEFERQLAAHGIVQVKFWLHIGEEEQLRRFRAREAVSYKRFKITDEDWRNREQRPQYLEAVNEMLRRTDTPHAPWHVVAADDKWWARIEVLRRYCDALQKAL